MKSSALRCLRGLSGVELSWWCRAMSTVVSPQWIFLGPPGVGKGTYSKRIAQHLAVPQISAGDLVREEISRQTPLGNEMKKIIADGSLLPDAMIMKIMEMRLESEQSGFVLDGFPRTLAQAEGLMESTKIHLVINLDLQEEVLVEKCLGRRICEKCKGDFNVADIYLRRGDEKKDIVMPPLPPPDRCLQYMKRRDDDREEIVKKRIEDYRQLATPIEEFYREQGILLDFEITGGIPETLPGLLEVLNKWIPQHHDAKHESMNLQETLNHKEAIKLTH